MIETLSRHLWHINRNRKHYEAQILRKRLALGYTISITILVILATLCWILRPVPFGNGQGVFLDNSEPKFHTQHGDRR